ncbi:hypothetical protein DY000_02002584 [Brassica cretica]|uniref:Uncharacterized protein n=1 Tax=Brassica cretica TaxID=69181 RepID=A0ABQ7C4K3_BRACR|nr:hypothetical protein DY000_02002584 [Brassica cretica]
MVSHLRTSLGKDRGIADLFRHYFSDESSISQDCSTWKTNKYINVSQFPGGSSSEMKIGSVAYCIVFQYVNISVLVFAVVNGFSYIATLDCYVGPRTESVDWMFF